MAKETKTKKNKRPTALKRDIQNVKKREINRQFKSQVRTAIRLFDDSIKSGSSTESQDSLKQIYSLMDKGVKRGIYKINKASRTKARFCARAATISN